MTPEMKVLTNYFQASDAAILHHALQLVIHLLQLLLEMGSILLPHCLHLGGGDVWYSRLQGVPCPRESWQQGAR
jgi:hypothetical protein